MEALASQAIAYDVADRPRGHPAPTSGTIAVQGVTHADDAVRKGYDDV